MVFRRKSGTHAPQRNSRMRSTLSSLNVAEERNLLINWNVCHKTDLEFETFFRLASEAKLPHQTWF